MLSDSHKKFFETKFIYFVFKFPALNFNSRASMRANEKFSRNRQGIIFNKDILVINFIVVVNSSWTSFLIHTTSNLAYDELNNIKRDIHTARWERDELNFRSMWNYSKNFHFLYAPLYFYIIFCVRANLRGITKIFCHQS